MDEESNVNDDNIPIIGGNPGLIINLGANPETKAAIEEIVGGALAQLGMLHAQQVEGSIDATLCEVAAATLQRTLSSEKIGKMETMIQARYREKA